MSDLRGQGTGLVLAGGGVRGAYEVGVIDGIAEVLGRRPGPAPFRVFAGTSVGAINAAYLAAHADAGDCGIRGLVGIWQRLHLRDHFRLDPLGLFRGPRDALAPLKWLLRGLGRGAGRSILDPRPLERLVRENVILPRLHENIAQGRVAALAVAALEIATGRTAIFVEHAPDVAFRPSLDPQRQPRSETIEAEHVLASMALPLLFPARRIGTRYYCDGGLRFNTPIAPAIRLGADKLVVVSPTTPSRAPADPPIDHTPDYPSVPFLLGKLLDALLLDPIAYDLQVLDRFNRLYEVLEDTVPASALAKVQEVLAETRGAAYRRIETLVFSPSEDIGRIAARFIEDDLRACDIGRLGRQVLERATRTRVGSDSDLASYLLFDGRFAEELIDMGRRDAHQRAEEIGRFFA